MIFLWSLKNFTNLRANVSHARSQHSKAASLTNQPTNQPKPCHISQLLTVCQPTSCHPCGVAKRILASLAMSDAIVFRTNREGSVPTPCSNKLLTLSW